MYSYTYSHTKLLGICEMVEVVLFHVGFPFDRLRFGEVLSGTILLSIQAIP